MFVPNEFRIFAHGRDFDPDAYQATASLPFDEVWHKGQSGRDHPKSSGVSQLLGDGRTLSTFEQEQIAIAYLQSHRDRLKALASYPGVTTFILGLQYHMKLDGGVVAFCMGPPADLMRIALDIGISPIYYVSLDNGE